MNAKNLITAVLLVFVAASIVALAVNEIRRSPKADQPGDQPATTPAEDAEGADQPPADGVIAYYFHRTGRCPTCMSIEAYAQEAVKIGFAEQLKDGRLQWRVVNYELPENEHFAADYQLVAPTVVLVELGGGKQKSWKDLSKVWDLVGDKTAFVEYVQQEARVLLEGPGT